MIFIPNKYNICLARFYFAIFPTCQRTSSPVPGQKAGKKESDLFYVPNTCCILKGSAQQAPYSYPPACSRKEVFQPHLPVRLPCYDLAPVTSFALGRPSRLRTSGTPGSHGLTGGVYKARERIHRAMADARLQLHGVGLQTPIRTTTGFRDPRPIAGWLPAVPAIVTRV